MGKGAMKMNWEKCCGAVLFTRDSGDVRYVLTRNLKGLYGFPKGHVEAGESEHETALREIGEEVSIRPVFVDGFREATEYPLKDKDDTFKQVVFFLAEYSGQEVVFQQEELTGAEILPYEEAMEKLSFENLREILKKANAFLKQE